MPASHDVVARTYLSEEQAAALRNQTLADQARAILAMGAVMQHLQVSEPASLEVMSRFSKRINELGDPESSDAAGSMRTLCSALGSTATKLEKPAAIGQPPVGIETSQPAIPGVQTAPNDHLNCHGVAQGPVLQAEAPVKPPRVNDTAVEPAITGLPPEPDSEQQELTPKTAEELRPESATEDPRLCKIGIDTLEDLCGQSSRRIFETLTESGAETFVCDLVKLATERFSHRSTSADQQQIRINIIAARVVEGIKWRAISNRYNLSPGAAYSNYATFKKILARGSDEEISEILDTLLPAPGETTEPLIDTLVQPPAPGSEESLETSRASLGFTNDAAKIETPEKTNLNTNIYDRLCGVLNYTTRDQRRTLRGIFDMGTERPPHTQEANIIYGDLTTILDLTIGTKGRSWPRIESLSDSLELKVLNTILRGTKNGAPLAPLSARGKLHDELVDAKREFEDVLKSALEKFVAAREEILGR